MSTDANEPSELPDEITVSGLTYTVERVKDLVHEDGDKCQGLTDTDEQTIQIEATLRSHDPVRLTLLHELCHVFESHAGLSLKEPQIDSLARSVLSLVRDNPELVRWLQAPKPQRRKKCLNT